MASLQNLCGIADGGNLSNLGLQGCVYSGERWRQVGMAGIARRRYLVWPLLGPYSVRPLESHFPQNLQAPSLTEVRNIQRLSLSLSRYVGNNLESLFVSPSTFFSLFSLSSRPTVLISTFYLVPLPYFVSFLSIY